MDSYGNWTANYKKANVNNHVHRKFNNQRNKPYVHKQHFNQQNNRIQQQNFDQQGQNLENPQFFCQLCDRQFFNSYKLEEHKTEHKTCGIDGCTFTAHFKIVEQHINFQHITGLYDKIKNLQTPEDIENWRQQRRKNHACTRGAIDKKENLQKAKEQRGERIMERNNRFGRDNKRMSLVKNHQYNKNCPKQLDISTTQQNYHKNTNEQKHNNHTNTRNQQNYNEPKYPYNKNYARRNRINKKFAEKPIQDFEREDWNGSMFPFRGTKQLSESIANCESTIDDEEWDENKQKEEAKSTNALSSLLGMYATSDESENEEEKIANKDDALTDTKIIDSGDDAPQEIKISHVPTFETESPAQQKKQTPNSSKRKENNTPPAYFKRRKISLLEKLLDKDIRHERNIILQCVRHVVKNNFFK